MLRLRAREAGGGAALRFRAEAFPLRGWRARVEVVRRFAYVFAPSRETQGTCGGSCSWLARCLGTPNGSE